MRGKRGGKIRGARRGRGSKCGAAKLNAGQLATMRQILVNLEMKVTVWIPHEQNYIIQKFGGSIKSANFIV